MPPKFDSSCRSLATAGISAHKLDGCSSGARGRMGAWLQLIGRWHWVKAGILRLGDQLLTALYAGSSMKCKINTGGGADRFFALDVQMYPDRPCITSSYTHKPTLHQFRTLGVCWDFWKTFAEENLRICYQIFALAAEEKSGRGFKQTCWRLSSKQKFLMSPLLLIYFGINKLLFGIAQAMCMQTWILGLNPSQDFSHMPVLCLYYKASNPPPTRNNRPSDNAAKQYTSCGFKTSQ